MYIHVKSARWFFHPEEQFEQEAEAEGKQRRDAWCLLTLDSH